MMVTDSNNLINNFGRHENSCMIVSGNVFYVMQFRKNNAYKYRKNAVDVAKVRLWLA